MTIEDKGSSIQGLGSGAESATDGDSVENRFANYTTQCYYSIHGYGGHEKSGAIPLEAIMGRVYGRIANLLEASAAQAGDQGLPNDTLVKIDLESDWGYEQALADFDAKEIPIGYDRASFSPILKLGLTQMEYWLSIKSADQLSEVTVADSGAMDLEGETVMNYDGRLRGATPRLNSIIADLIRRGEIPRGVYLFDHSW